MSKRRFYMNFYNESILFILEVLWKGKQKQKQIVLTNFAEKLNFVEILRIKKKSSRGFRVYQHLLFKGIVCELSLIEIKLSEFPKAAGHQNLRLSKSRFSFFHPNDFSSLFSTKKFFFRIFSLHKNLNFKLLLRVFKAQTFKWHNLLSGYCFEFSSQTQIFLAKKLNRNEQAEEENFNNEPKQSDNLLSFSRIFLFIFLLPKRKIKVQTRRKEAQRKVLRK